MPVGENVADPVGDNESENSENDTHSEDAVDNDYGMMMFDDDEAESNAEVDTAGEMSIRHGPWSVNPNRLYDEVDDVSTSGYDDSVYYSDDSDDAVSCHEHDYGDAYDMDDEVHDSDDGAVSVAYCLHSQS